MTAKTYGYSRKRDLPAVEGNPKVCSRCDLWFMAGPRERACHGCLRPAERARRAATHPSIPGRLVSVQKGQVRGAQNGTYSDVLHLTFKPGVPLWHQLALEAAAEQCWSYHGRRR